ncbi:uncharacterized protein LOC144575243 isoform X2 [Carex rostrata]
MMATSIELPIKREYEYGDEEEEALKKAKTEKEGDKEANEDEIMADSFADEDEGTDSSEEEEEDVMLTLEKEAELYNQIELDDNFAKVDIVREYQLFCRLTGDPDREKKIFSENDALDLLSDDEINRFWKKTWHMRPNPSGLSDYEVLTIYPYEDHPFYYDYAFLSRTYEYDRTYQKFIEELHKKIEWSPTRSDGYARTKEILKGYPGLLVDDYDAINVDNSANVAIALSHARQNAKELIPLFVELYKLEMNKEDIVQSLKLIVDKKGGLECYPLNKVLIEEALRNEKGPGISLMSKTGEASVEEDNKLEDLVTGYFEQSMVCVDDYTDYVNEKIRVAQVLKIIDDSYSVPPAVLYSWW